MTLVALTLCAFLVAHYPLGPFIPAVGLLSYALVVFYRPSIFLIIIPALIPLIGFAPWTGWISFEELDLLVLATAAGAYARYAFDGKRQGGQRTSSLLIVLSVLMSASILISMARGFADAGGFVFGWFQGYDGSMNSIRIGKSFFLALLLLPLLIRQQYSAEQSTSRKLALGIALGLCAASLAALWERLAYTDLLNFSSDYRSTALFWEMHVGGAALDGWLLLTFPFSIWALRHSRNALQYACSILLIGLAAYASLTTFSRGVYLALVVSLPLLAWQTRRRFDSAQAAPETPAWGFFRWMFALVFLGSLAGLVFPAGGYRGLIAMLGLLAVSLSMPPTLRKMSLGNFATGGSVGLFIGMAVVLSANLLPKGPYVLYSLLLFLTLLTLYWPGMQNVQNRSSVCLASFCCLLLSAADVTYFWGGTEALWGMSLALTMLILLLAWATFTRHPLWPDQLRWQGNLMVVAVAASCVVAVFVGGGYMTDRFSTTGKDFGGRLSHWRQTISMLKTPWDMVFGKGLGRFPANYYFDIPTGEFPGSYRVTTENGNSFLSLVAPRHPMSFGDILRMSQRLSFDAHGPFVLDFKIKTKATVEIHAEVCEKHLLYSGSCAIGNVAIKATHGEWQSEHLRLDGPLLGTGPWYAPRFKTFSLGIGNQSGAAEVDDLLLSSTGSPNLLANNDFSNEMQHWFFSSDHDHMPWHAKNLLVNILFDQGTTGLVLFLLLTSCALWRLNLGKARLHEFSPYLNAAIIGFLAVGLFDSLTDVPRLAFLYYLLILYALSLGASFRKISGKPSKSRKPGDASKAVEPLQSLKK